MGPASASRSGRRCIARGDQHGYVLLLVVALLAAALLYLLIVRFDAGSVQRMRDRRTADALATAKAAIIAWSVANATAPGRLPCPEDTAKIGTALEGQAQSACSNSSPTIGRLPWKTLQLEPLRDGYGEPLWYALSPGFRSSPINADTPAQLTLDGVPAVAVVFSPGPPVGNQMRPAYSAASPPLVGNYLDTSNADGDGAFTAVGDVSVFDDRVLAITSQELFSAVGQRVAGEVANALMVYFCGGQANVGPNQACLTPAGPHNLPRPAVFSDPTCLGSAEILGSNCGNVGAINEGRIAATPPWTDYDALSPLRGTTGSGNWFQSNGWRELTYIAVSDKCLEPHTDCNGAGVFLTVDSATGVRVVVIMTGSALAPVGQAHATTADRTTVSNYLENDNASVGDGRFTSGVATGSFNDVVRMIR